MKLFATPFNLNVTEHNIKTFNVQPVALPLCLGLQPLIILVIEYSDCSAD